ncbi:MAG: hypothetical protein KME30_18450 [Iphinoe sp. HA4291-MV1]|jgi:hypothetical protein|nr:hypothetical protein [Iphinoe sp. HA4291-MV1]
MKLKLTRRQFGQLMIASTAVAGLGYLGKKTFAQTPLITSSTIYGAHPDRQRGGLVLQSLNLTTKQIQDIGTVPIERGERLESLTYLALNTFLLTIGPVTASKKENDPPRLVTVILGQIPVSVPVPGFNKLETLRSVRVTNDGSLIALVHRKDKKSARLVNLNARTAAISNRDNIKLPENERFDNLVQLPNGITYTTIFGLQGDTSLVPLNLETGQVSQGVQLKINGTVWNNGFTSLASAPGNLIYAVGNGRHLTPNNLYTIDPSTGAITLVQQWDAVKIATNVGGILRGLL